VRAVIVDAIAGLAFDLDGHTVIDGDDAVTQHEQALRAPCIDFTTGLVLLVKSLQLPEQFLILD
jgi:hypothetical protein